MSDTPDTPISERTPLPQGRTAFDGNAMSCPQCASKNVECIDKPGDHHHECHDCGYGGVGDSLSIALHRVGREANS